MHVYPMDGVGSCTEILVGPPVLPEAAVQGKRIVDGGTVVGAYLFGP